jgi:hypothetical protein
MLHLLDYILNLISINKQKHEHYQSQFPINKLDDDYE